MERRSRGLITFLAISGFALLAIYPLLCLPSWYANGDFFRYLVLMEEFKKSFENGNWYPRWMPALLGGFGYPTFLFYQPGFFFFLLPFTYLPITLTHAFIMAFFTALIISGLGAYKLARLFANDRVISTVFAGMFILMPYIYCNLYSRGDYSEFLGTVLCPWVMVGIFKIRKELPGPVHVSSFLLYVLATTAVFYSHPHVSLFLILLVMWLALTSFILDGYRDKFAYILALGGVTAAVLSAPYWLTILQLGQYVTLHNAQMPPVLFLPMWQMFVNRVPAGGYPGEDIFGISRVAVIGIPQFLLSLAGLYWGIRRRLCWQIGIPWLLSIYMVSTWSIPVWHKYIIYQTIHYPWRILSITTILQYMAMLQWGAWRNGGSFIRRRFMLTALLVAGMFLTLHVGVHNQWALKLDDRYMRLPPPVNADAIVKQSQPVFGNYTNFGEFNPLWMHPTFYYNQSRLHPPMIEWEPNPYMHMEVMASDPYKHMQFQLDSDNSYFRFPFESPFPVGDLSQYIQTEESSEGQDVANLDEAMPFKCPDAPYRILPADMYALPDITINHMYFPGWIATVNGKILSVGPMHVSGEEALIIDPFGRMRLQFPRFGHYEVELYYDGPPAWQIRNLLMLIVLVIIGFACVKSRLFIKSEFHRKR